MDQSQRSDKERKIMAGMMNFAPKPAKKIRIKVGVCNKLYVPELRANFLFTKVVSLYEHTPTVG